MTWNIQATKGCDGRFSVTRIVEHLMSYGTLDVICLQELARHIPDLNSDDQPSLIAGQFPGYEVVWAPGFSVPDASNKRMEFGNLTLIKQVLFKNSRIHSLPSPSVPERQIPRTMAEAILSDGASTVSIFNAHLAFHSMLERQQQMTALTQLRNQHLARVKTKGSAPELGLFGFTDSCDGVIMCGDLNLASDSNEFTEFVVDQQWVDCWETQQDSAAYAEPRQPTCGCFDLRQWPEGPHVRDYFLATENIARRTERVEVNVLTDASDHQPVLLELNE